MHAVAKPMHGSVNPFSTPTTDDHAMNQGQLAPDEQYISTFFCRALYDYQARDASSLSFHKNDIIEVLTQLESGWWDGLLGDERGWFPSNYVTPISDEEAEAALFGSEYSAQPLPTSQESVDMPQGSNLSQEQADRDRDWLGSEMDATASRNGAPDVAAIPPGRTMQPSDFWIPKVTSDGQIYYVNTQTGQHSRDLPQEADDEVAEGDLSGFSSSSSRAGAGAGLGLGIPTRVDSNEDVNGQAGFGVPKRSGTPEPWVRRLADDGMSYYYQNKLDGTVQWTLPTSPVGRGVGQVRHRGNSSMSSGLTYSPIPPSVQPSVRVDPIPPPLRGRRPTISDHHSVYSDDSDIDPRDRGRSNSFSHSRSSPNEDPADMGHHSAARYPSGDRGTVIQLTPAERLAQSLQQALAPSPPEMVTELSDIARRAISAVVAKFHTLGSPLAEDGNDLEDIIVAAVITVRDLLYVSAPSSGHIPSNLIPPHARDSGVNTASQALLKPAQRKVTATLSKLVLSARAIQYDSSLTVPDTPSRIEVDAEELERAVVGFVLEVQRNKNQALVEQLGQAALKRLRGVFQTANIGLGLVGAGAAGSWKGFGWVALEEPDEGPGRILGPDVISELETHLSLVEERCQTLAKDLKSDEYDDSSVCSESQNVITHLSAFLKFVANIHVARHVDIDGIGQESGSSNELYAQSIEKARSLVRMLEAAVQALYDDGATLLMDAQSIRKYDSGKSEQDKEALFYRIDCLCGSLKVNLRLVKQTLEALLSIGHDQADMSQGDYTGSIEWRMSRMSMVDNRYRPLSPFDVNSLEPEGDLVDMEVAFSKSSKLQSEASSHDRNARQIPPEEPVYRSASQDTASMTSNATSTLTLVPEESSKQQSNTEDSSQFVEDEPLSDTPARRRGAGAAQKLQQVLGEVPTHVLNTATADTKPWYLRPNYDPSEILIDPDGTVKGGTVPALVERLTAHEHGDPNFIKTFLMTFKSFTTVDELFELLVLRFNIQPPPNLTPEEHQDWVKLKQHVIQMRVLNTFKSMIQDEDVLEKEDLYILDRMKAFISTEEVHRSAAAKQLLISIERLRGGDAKVFINTSQERPPPPILPKNPKKPKLLDIDPLELARQLTILESGLYQKIRPMECLVRSRKQSGDHNDNIATIIQLCNRIALWVTNCILEKEDSRKRATILKQFINVADRCRSLHNYSSMVAIISGLNNPPIRRLKRTWEQINSRFMSLLGACEMTIDTGKNFANYRTTLAKVAPPCVPFIGVFLTTLTFIQDGAEDNLQPNVVNFRKRQKASEVIRDIKRWQSPSYNLLSIPSIQTYLEDSLKQFIESQELGDHFWNLSLEREPREREDEKMARLLQESGFL